MPFTIRRLDTRVPATWDGEDESAGDPYLDDDTALRATAGEDGVNYYVRQRVEGDLHKRDLVNEQNLRNMVNFLATRTGLRYGVPAVRVKTGDSVILGRVTVPTETPKWYVVGGELVNLTDSASGAVLEVIKVSDSSVVWSSSTYGVSFAAAALTDRGPLLVAGQTYLFRMTNGTGAVKVLSGSVLVQPRTYA